MLTPLRLMAGLDKHFAPAPVAIVFRTTEQVQAIVRWANELGGTGGSGGRTGCNRPLPSIGEDGEVVVSFDYMNQILDVNLTDRTAVCRPGVVCNCRTSPKKKACAAGGCLIGSQRLATISAPSTRRDQGHSLRHDP